eukprot:1227351-Amphidinium_carterae.1
MQLWGRLHSTDLIVVLHREASVCVPWKHWQHVDALHRTAGVILLQEGLGHALTPHTVATTIITITIPKS